MKLNILKFGNRDQSSRPGAAQLEPELVKSTTEEVFEQGIHALFEGDFPFSEKHVLPQ